MQVERRDKYQQMRMLLNEKQWRQYLALEAKERGSFSQHGSAWGQRSGSGRRLFARRPTAQARWRRKKTSEKDAALLADSEGLLEPKGDPMSLLKWTSKSVAHLKAGLQAMGHTIADTALRDVLLSLGYSLRANKKTIEGNSHEDRDAQFARIKERCDQFEQADNPIISVDGKKKELIGTFKNHGREWQAKGEGRSVNVYDFLSLASGRAIPYGVYDLVHNREFVNVGIDHDTAECAVESIRRWW